MRYISGLIIALSFIFYGCDNVDNQVVTDPVVDSTTVDNELEGNIKILSQQIRKTPMDASLFAKRGALYIENDQPDDAINDLEIALKLDSLKPEYYFQLAEYHMMLGKSGAAKDIIEKCLTFFPQNTEALIKLADIHLYVRQYKVSMDFLLKAEKIDNQIPFLYFLKGLIFLELGDTTMAVENFQITVDKDPGFYNAYINLGLMYAAKGDSLAIAYYQNAQKIIPNSIEAHYNLGLFYQENYRYSAAVNEYNYIIEKIDSNYAYAHHNIGYIHMHYLGNYNAAIPYFEKAYKLQPNYVEALYHIGLCYEMLDKFAEAKKIYESTFVLVPNYDLAVKALNRIDGKIKK